VFTEIGMTDDQVLRIYCTDTDKMFYDSLDTK